MLLPLVPPGEPSLREFPGASARPAVDALLCGDLAAGRRLGFDFLVPVAVAVALAAVLLICSAGIGSREWAGRRPVLQGYRVGFPFGEVGDVDDASGGGRDRSEVITLGGVHESKVDAAHRVGDGFADRSMLLYVSTPILIR